MPKIQFLGAVLPLEIVKVGVTNIPEIETESPDGLKAKFQVHVFDSKVVVDCELNRFVEEDFSHLYIRAVDFSRAAVDMVAFCSGMALSVHLHSLIRPDGELTAIRLSDPSLVGICTAYKLEAKTDEDRKTFANVMLLVFGEPPLFMALNDLTQANAVPHCAPVNCGRVLDGLKKIVAPGVDDKKAWPILRSIVNADEKY